MGMERRVVRRWDCRRVWVVEEPVRVVTVREEREKGAGREMVNGGRWKVLWAVLSSGCFPVLGLLSVDSGAKTEISTSPISVPPVVQPLLMTLTSTLGNPILSHSGKSTCCIYSLEGLLGTFVPPLSRIRKAGESIASPSSRLTAGIIANTIYGKIACQINQTLPGFFNSITSGVVELAVLRNSGRGLKTTSELPTSSPSTVALHSVANHVKAAR